MIKYRSPFIPILLTFAIGFQRPSASQAADFVWLEGEAPASINVKPQIAGWGHPAFLSGGKWLQVAIDADKIDADVPAGGALLRYDFKANAAGKHEIWNRIGYEFARSPFEWRIDKGSWSTVGPDALTTDLMELQDWNEVAWLKLGDADLAAGRHSLEIRLPTTLDDKGKPARVLYASDAICVYPGAFHPDSKYRPGEDHRTAEDREGARKVFDLPEAAAPDARSSVRLNGLWEICRHDEDLPRDVAAPMAGLPAEPHWSAIAVPGDKNALRPDLLFAHRVWYRTHINVPASLAGRSFFLTFPQNNLNTTVYVNGVLCGFDKNPYARIQIDVTKGIRPGANEIRVGIRDAWYGYSASPTDPLKLRRKFNIPLGVAGSGFQDLAYPIWHAFQSGILATPELTAAGPVYASDVFVKPSVARKELAAEITLRNTTDRSASGQILWQAVLPATGDVVRSFVPQSFRLEAGEVRMFPIAERWENPKLWWPDDPNLYRLRATVTVEGKPVDVSETTFGFREWGSAGRDFTLNGVPWHMWGDLVQGKTKEEWLANYRRTGQRTMRLMGAAQGGPDWYGLTPDEALGFFDQNGVVVRRCGPLDGEAIGYDAVENDPKLKLYGSGIKMDLMQNWRDQMVAQVKGERNHPSIQIWSIENEWLYINCLNLYGGLMDEFESEVAKTSDAVRAADPTRLTMTDGGGANRDQSMPVHGNHYVFDPKDTRYPELAYEDNPAGGGRGRWVWDMKRPRFIGEDYYATGINPADYAYFGGEEAFQGKGQALPAAGLIYRMLMEGYRWSGQSAWQFWLGEESASDQYGSNAPIAVFCRQWDWTFGSGQKVPRTFGIFNDTHSADPITFTWSLTVDGRRVAGETNEHHVPPGRNEKLDVTLEMPRVTSRQEGSLALSLSVNGQPVFQDTKAISILPEERAAAIVAALPAAAIVAALPAASPPSLQTASGPSPRAAVVPLSSGTGGSPGPSPSGASPSGASPSGPSTSGLTGSRPPARVAPGLTPGARAIRIPPDRPRLGGASGRRARPRRGGGGPLPGALPPAGSAAVAPAPSGDTLWVYDPYGTVPAFLKAIGVPFTALQSLGILPASAKVLIIGKDALTPAESASSRLAAYAAEGRTVILLEQKNPLRYQGLPADMEPSTAEGRTAYGEDMGHPALQGLQQKDFFTWGPDGVVYRDAYLKPTRGGRSLVQCDARLMDTALAEVPAGKGLLLLCQMTVGEKLTANAVAQHLLTNLIRYGAAYRLEYRPAALVADPASEFAKAVNAVGLTYTEARDPLQAIGDPRIQLALVEATPANLRRLSGALPQLAAFTGRGGYLFLNGLTPDGLADYNRIVGFDHMIRPFRRERVTFAPTRHPLTSGLTTGDIVMLSGERIFDWTSDEYVAPDIFSYVVDYDDVAPFARFPNDFLLNLVNGMVTADAWKYIVNVPAPENGPIDWPLVFPKPQTISGVEWTGNTIYYPVTRFELLFDGKDAASFSPRPNNDPQTFAVDPPRTGTTITLRLADWDRIPGKNAVTGLDNIRLLARRPPDFYKQVRPMLNIGAMLEYPRGPGGIVLCNLLFQPVEAVPVNRTKKLAIIATLLRNLKAPFSSGQAVIAGADLRYEPIAISKQADQYRDERGWFGDPKYTFKDLPTGRQVFAGVPFQIYSFPTSPVPTAVMLDGPGVPNHPPAEVRGIPVNRKADALFFLQAARIDARRNESEVRADKRYELARYVVTYADGQAIHIPLYAEIDVDDYRQKEPAPLPGAQIAWTRPYEGTDLTAVAYMKQWNNPRPDVEIRSVDLEPGADGRGVPALLAITAAQSP